MSNASLIKRMDAFYEALLEQAAPVMVPVEGQPDVAKSPIAFLDQLKLFEAGARWVHVRNRLTLEDDTDEFGKLRDGYSGSRGRRRASS